MVMDMVMGMATEMTIDLYAGLLYSETPNKRYDYFCMIFKVKDPRRCS